MRDMQHPGMKGSGRLRLFLGAVSGVGATSAMLQAAREYASRGADLLVGVVDAHGQPETAELLLGLELAGSRQSHLDPPLLDLDAVLRRNPGLVVIDDLWRENPPGSRHPSRYLDADEILAAGIDVFATISVDRIASLGDEIERITGLRVTPTLPDRVVQRAEMIELVDLPIEELLLRIRDGRIRSAVMEPFAGADYFRPGNLAALRQLALRQTAARVDWRMQSEMNRNAISGPWGAVERLMVCVGESPLSARLVRATRRRADRRNAEWLAVHVEGPGESSLDREARARIAEHLRLAVELGGETLSAYGTDVAATLLEVAAQRHVTEIVLGRSTRSPLRDRFRGTIVGRLIRGAGPVDIHVIAGNEQTVAPPSSSRPAVLHRLPIAAIAWSVVAVACATLLGHLLSEHLTVPNLSMVFLSVVLLTAVRWGLSISIFVSILSVATYDFFLVEPRYTFSISSPQDLLALVTFLFVAVLTSNLTGRIRDAARVARRRDQHNQALLTLSRDLAAAVGPENVARTIAHNLAETLQCGVAVMLRARDRLEQIASMPADTVLSEREEEAVSWVASHGVPAGLGQGSFPDVQRLLLPMTTGEETVGVLALQVDRADAVEPHRRHYLEALSSQSAIAVARARLARDLEEARIIRERERMQSVLLSSISHDLRTPLAAILGAGSSLQEHDAVYGREQRAELLATLVEEARRLDRFVGNVLDFTRVESGTLALKRQWHDPQDLVGSALRRLRSLLADRPVELSIPPTLRPLFVDFVLFEQVLVNLLDNAAKYSPSGSPIVVAARDSERDSLITVEDRGRGIPPYSLEAVFDRFRRLESADRTVAGTGLGLSICRGIVHAHGGEIRALSPIHGSDGTRIEIRLPNDAAAPPSPDFLETA